jgi:predicted secreted protein
MSMIRLALAALAMTPALAQAGDAATAHILGFSEDGRIFVLEEFGVQDGSGFPYANRFYIDTATDTFLPGTPIRVRIDDEAAEVATARAQARDKGEKVVASSVLQSNPGFTAGWNALTEASADPFRMVVYPRPVFPAIDAPVEFRLAEIPLAPPAGCENLGETMGFRLVRIDAAPDAATTILHEDAAIPASRRCPQGYTIGGVQTFYPRGGEPVFAVVIAVRSMGFEGPDFRWIAVTGRL